LGAVFEDADDLHIVPASTVTLHHKRAGIDGRQFTCFNNGASASLLQGLGVCVVAATGCEKEDQQARAERSKGVFIPHIMILLLLSFLFSHLPLCWGLIMPPDRFLPDRM